MVKCRNHPSPTGQPVPKLPPRWRLIHGAYYFTVPPGFESAWDGRKLFRLGKTLPEAYRTWAARAEAASTARTIGDLLDRYMIEVVPSKAPKTATDNRRQIARLRATFGAMPLLPFAPRLAYQYHDKRPAKTAAKRELEVLSHAYTMAVKWGYIDHHPFKGELELPGNKPRTRYVEDWEIVECLALPARGAVAAVQAYIKVKLLTGLRRSDLLLLTMSEIRDDGLHVTPHKTANSSGKRLIIEWSPELRAAIEEAKTARRVISPWLFCKGTGGGYWRESHGDAPQWNKTWQAFMRRVLEETKVIERFTEHDLWAKCGSDADTLEHARQLLAHADSRTTERVYRRKAERVKPLR